MYDATLWSGVDPLWSARCSCHYDFTSLPISPNWRRNDLCSNNCATSHSFWSSKLQQTKGSPISIVSPLSTLAPAGAGKVEYNDIHRHTWLGYNYFANALEDIGAKHLVFGLLACQGTRSPINFRPGERYCQTLVYNYSQGQPLCILVLVFHGICQGAWSHEEHKNGGNDGELHDGISEWVLFKRRWDKIPGKRNGKRRTSDQHWKEMSV